MRVIIIGAGIGGLATAIAARREGLEVTVIERAAELLPVSSATCGLLWCNRSTVSSLVRLALASKSRPTLQESANI